MNFLCKYNSIINVICTLFKKLGVHDSRYGMGIGDAWNFSMTGENVTLGVLDVGVDITHPYLLDNIVSIHLSEVFVLLGDIFSNVK